MKAKVPSHPNFGKSVKLEQKGRDVILTFEAGTQAQAEGLFENLLVQLKAGDVNINLSGKATNVHYHS